MPLFFFHLRTDTHLDEDTIGVDLPDLDAVRREALAAVADMVRDEAVTGRAVPGEAFEVVDREGHPVLAVPFGMSRGQTRAG